MGFRVPGLVVGWLAAFALAQAETTITGTAVDAGSKRPLEFVAVSLKKTDGAVVQSTVTDSRGRFVLEKIPPGEYVVAYNVVGADARATPRFTVDAPRRSLDLGRLELAPPDIVKLEKIEVQAKGAVMLNSIDRKVYLVGKDIQSTTGSASDLLQNLPSVQVDIDGNVSLRGSDSVMILINGRTSALMGRSRAEALAQLPADSIEKIEVITNPSAKYKPDGTGGIINIALKRKRAGLLTASLNTAVGNEQRYNAGLLLNFNPGKFSSFGNLSVRQDDRERHSSQVRTSGDPVTGAVTRLENTSTEHSRPFTQIARGGVEYAVDEHNKFGLTADYEQRRMTRRGTDFYLSRDARGAVSSDFERIRYDPEMERSAEAGVTYHHKFPEEDHELNFEFRWSRTREREDNLYTSVHRAPARAPSSETIRIAPLERDTEAIVEYVLPLDHDAKFEAGYTRSTEQLDANFTAEYLDSASGRWLNDTTRTNRFKYRDTIHAFYATYGRSFGKFGFLAGLRPEFTIVKTHLVTTDTRFSHDYNRVYPSLHLAYKLTEKHEVQLNYSHRVHRPDADELNPFPEYADPFNLRAGNPRLVPEDVHSVEAGYSFHHDDTTLTSTVYHRHRYHGFTSITRDIGGGVLLTTQENLAQNRSTGLELTANTELGKRVSLNFSSNIFFNTINATNLGFASDKSDISWLAKLGASIRLPRDTLLQFNTNYASARLTPQGSRHAVYVANIGVRHNFWQKKAALVLTVSDLFNTLKDASTIDTPTLQQEVVRRRSPRIVYLGFIYHFGKPAKKGKEEEMKFDNTL